jgi:hypothetical protein
VVRLGGVWLRVCSRQWGTVGRPTVSGRAKREGGPVLRSALDFDCLVARVATPLDSSTKERRHVPSRVAVANCCQDHL